MFFHLTRLFYRFQKVKPNTYSYRKLNLNTTNKSCKKITVNPTTSSAIEVVHGRRRSGNAPLSRELFISLWSLYCSSSHAQQHWKLTHTWNSSTNHSFYWLLLLFSVFCVGQKQFASCWPAFVSSPAHSVHSVSLFWVFLQQYLNLT